MFRYRSSKLFDLHQRTTQNEISMQDDGLGTKIEDLYLNTNPWDHYVPPLEPSENHTVLFKQPVPENNPPEPTEPPEFNNDLWDNDNYVKLPFYSGNVYQDTVGNTEVTKPRWELIKTSLSRPINSAEDLEKAILSYIPPFAMPVHVQAGLSNLFKMGNTEVTKPRWELIKTSLSRPINSAEDLEKAILSYIPPFAMPVHVQAGLSNLFKMVLSEEESNYFFQTLLPQIIKLTLQLPELVQSPIPILSANKAHTISLSQLQIASLLANAFLCTFPRYTEFGQLPTINFFPLYLTCNRNNSSLTRIKCFLNYFYRVCTKTPVGVVTFERKFISQENLPKWEELDTKFTNTELNVTTIGTIDNDGIGCLQVDFADMIIGGAILDTFDSTQEQIIFSLNPELIVSRLFTTFIQQNEAVQITGVERFNCSTGYGSQFQWVGNFQDDTPFDCYGRRKKSFIAIDASTNAFGQYTQPKMLRDLNKAFIGYHETMNVNNEHLSPVATGKWGCGVFGGNVQLKSLLQIMACAVARRDVVYFTFGDTQARDEIYDMHQFLIKHNVTISKLWKYLCAYEQACKNKYHKYALTLYQFIQRIHLEEID